MASGVTLHCASAAAPHRATHNRLPLGCGVPSSTLPAERITGCTEVRCCPAVSRWRAWRRSRSTGCRHGSPRTGCGARRPPWRRRRPRPAGWRGPPRAPSMPVRTGTASITGDIHDMHLLRAPGKSVGRWCRCHGRTKSLLWASGWWTGSWSHCLGFQASYRLRCKPLLLRWCTGDAMQARPCGHGWPTRRASPEKGSMLPSLTRVITTLPGS
jgi:hypothetical protein